ncbi:hypothetical protein vseg_019294 [Gypsophila vaccaria]
MDNLDDEKLLQMVHDFIEFESTTPSYSPSSTKNRVNFCYSNKFLTLQEIMRKKTKEERKIEEKIEKYMNNKRSMEKTTSLKQWIVKCLMLDGFNASLRHITWLSCPSCPPGSYEYIEIIIQEDPKGEKVREMIVDIDFKSQFEVARPSESYKKLLNKIPSIFVGNKPQLSTLITLLCSACEDSLKDQGLHVPPWRRPTYMKSKWNLSNNHNNIDCNSNSNSNKLLNRYNYVDNQKLLNRYNYVDNQIYPNNDIGNGKVSFRREKWGPREEIGTRVELSGGGGTRLSNQFSKMSINCC